LIAAENANQTTLIKTREDEEDVTKEMKEKRGEYK